MQVVGLKLVVSCGRFSATSPVPQFEAILRYQQASLRGQVYLVARVLWEHEAVGSTPTSSTYGEDKRQVESLINSK